MQVENCPWFRWWLDRTKEKEICWNQNDRSNRDSRWHNTVRQKLGLKKLTLLRVLNHFSTQPQLQTSTSSTNFPNIILMPMPWGLLLKRSGVASLGRGLGEGGRPRDCPFCLGWKERGGGGENNILAETGLTAAWTRRRSPDRTKQFSRNQDRGRVKPSLIAFPQYLQSHRNL